MTHVPTKTEIREALAEAGLRPDTARGQHYLVDGNLMRRLVAEADLGPADTVLEVGAGAGNLTGLLAAEAGRVVAVEVDPEVAAVARARLAEAENVHLLAADALADKHHLNREVTAAVGRAREVLGGPWKLVANLPYQVATPLVVDLVLDPDPPERLVFTVQEEVADRLAAAPATRAYGPVGVLVQAMAEVEVLRRLPPDVFWPRPAVRSAMVRVRPSAARREGITDLAALRRTVAAIFAHRRKRAARSLALAEPSGGDAQAWAARLEACGLDPSARAEAYAVEGIVRLANALADE
ncbi:MAG: 16S rRNA (adenine(1518)-N(6)/adenine(1519)-N(6))-dimethyltransferase RsmA [Phycisphaerae bacterium]